MMIIMFSIRLPILLVHIVFGNDVDGMLTRRRRQQEPKVILIMVLTVVTTRMMRMKYYNMISYVSIYIMLKHGLSRYLVIRHENLFRYGMPRCGHDKMIGHYQSRHGRWKQSSVSPPHMPRHDLVPLSKTNPIVPPRLTS